MNIIVNLVVSCIVYYTITSHTHTNNTYVRIHSHTRTQVDEHTHTHMHAHIHKLTHTFIQMHTESMHIIVYENECNYVCCHLPVQTVVRHTTQGIGVNYHSPSVHCSRMSAWLLSC